MHVLRVTDEKNLTTDSSLQASSREIMMRHDFTSQLARNNDILRGEMNLRVAVTKIEGLD